MSMDSSDSSRLFLALWPEGDVRHELQVWQNGWNWPFKATPVRPESLHLTLHFLGNVPNSRLPELTHGLFAPFTPFELHFSRSALWPHGIAVLEPDTVPDDLLQLHASLRASLKSLALPTEERLFRPHITLARRADGATPPRQGAPVQWSVREYALMESRLGQRGGYGVVQRYT